VVCDVCVGYDRCTMLSWRNRVVQTCIQRFLIYSTQAAAARCTNQVIIIVK
jgi:hypothetical protein